jgi:hypothetical protein
MRIQHDRSKQSSKIERQPNAAAITKRNYFVNSVKMEADD